MAQLQEKKQQGDLSDRIERASARHSIWRMYHLHNDSSGGEPYNKPNRSQRGCAEYKMSSFKAQVP
jgi:hypothetical protein